MSARETAELLVQVGRLVQAEGYDGELNPAQWIGSAVAGSAFQHLEVYTVGPLVGAAIAALVYLLFLEDNKPLAPTDPIRVDPQG